MFYRLHTYIYLTRYAYVFVICSYIITTELNFAMFICVDFDVIICLTILFFFIIGILSSLLNCFLVITNNCKYSLF